MENMCNSTTGPGDVNSHRTPTLNIKLYVSKRLDDAEAMWTAHDLHRNIVRNLAKRGVA